jgi:hypothetical protein
MASSERTETRASPVAATSTSTVSSSPSTTPAADGEGVRPRRDAPVDTTAEGQTEITECQKFQIECLANTHYHQDRERYFARWHKIAMFVVVLGGAATFAPVIRQYWIGGIAVTLAGLLDLVFDVSGKARLHASLRRRIYDILADSQDGNIDLAKLKKRAIDVYADEPPCMHAVNALAHNSAMGSFERPMKLRMKIAWWQRFLRNVWPFPQTDFKTFEELDKARVAH